MDVFLVERIVEEILDESPLVIYILASVQSLIEKTPLFQKLQKLGIVPGPAICVICV